MWEAVAAMQAYGGSFVKWLGEGWLRADADNKQRLEAAFPEYFAQYAKMASTQKRVNPLPGD